MFAVCTRSSLVSLDKLGLNPFEHLGLCRCILNGNFENGKVSKLCTCVLVQKTRNFSYLHYSDFGRYWHAQLHLATFKASWSKAKSAAVFPITILRLCKAKMKTNMQVLIFKTIGDKQCIPCLDKQPNSSLKDFWITVVSPRILRKSLFHFRASNRAIIEIFFVNFLV